MEREAGAIAAEKRAMRLSVLAIRDALPHRWRQTASQHITRRLAGLPEWAEASTVLAYAGFGTEFDSTAVLASVLSSGRRLVLPRVRRSPWSLTLHVVTAPDRDLVTSAWGIREPDPDRCPALEPAEVDCVLVPGVAFDARGGRLGYGGGFYDRLLAGAGDASLIAAAFSLQLVPSVPMAAHDRRVPIIVTESATIRIR